MERKIKTGLYEDKLPPLIREIVEKENWTLCIGAGSSLPIFPNWHDLVKKMFIYFVQNQSNSNLFDQLAEQYSLDTILQSIYSNSNFDEDKFSELLSRSLYKTIIDSLGKRDWNTAKTVFSAVAPDDVSPIVWSRFHNVVQNYFLNTSVYHIAKFIQKSINEGFPPSAILSFNAEPFLYSMINYFSWLHSSKNKCSLFKPLDPITRSISQKTKKRIHYYFCHGMVKIPATQQRKEFLSTEKLVFLENEYLALSNNLYSWQASSFIDICNTQRVFFIGLSLIDPNIRKWLAWIQLNRENEIKRTFGSSHFTTHHYWINKIPENLDLTPWIEASVSHLGIRLIWLKHWDRLYDLFEKLI